MNTSKLVLLLLKNSVRTFNRNILCSLAALFILIATASGQPGNLVVNPAIVTQDAGTSFTVFVAFDFTGATPPLGADAVEVHLAFDNTKLQVTAMSEQPTVLAFTSKPIPLEAAPFTTTNTTGQINYAAATASGFPTADFNILSITFQIIGGGGTSTPLTLRRDFPANFSDVQRIGNSIVTSITSGNVTINAVGCTTPTATISAPGGGITCNSQAFNLTLASASNGTGPFDLTIAGPTGTATYNNIPVGGVITNFAPPVERLWPAPVFPLPTTFDDAVYTLGTKFTSSVSGFVKGVRFFAPDEVSAVAGNYTGQLWTEGGTLLASGVFGATAADSWNELLFTTPYLISAGTVYVVSYHTGVLPKYASTAGGLTANFTNGSLTAQANGGVFAAGATPTPPFASVGANYWVDVLFSPNQYAFNLTSVKDALECINTGALQTLNVTSVDCSTLPVTLINLSATPKDNTITLHWSTATELNNRGFEIQRRTDASEWAVVGFVNGAGNSAITRHYSYDDEKLSSNRYYYRLKQVDLDGRFEYSPVVSAVLGGTNSFNLEQNYPNPFRGETIIRFTIPQKTNVKLSLFDMHGRMVKTLVSGTKEKGTHAISFNASTLRSSIYYYKLETENFSAVKKMTIQ